MKPHASATAAPAPSHGAGEDIIDSIRSKLEAAGHRDIIVIDSLADAVGEPRADLRSLEMDWPAPIRRMTGEEISEACRERGLARRPRNTKVYGASVSGSLRRKLVRNA